MEIIASESRFAYNLRVHWGLASLLKIKAAICSYTGLHVGGLRVRPVLDLVRQPHMRPPGLASGGKSIKDSSGG